MDKKFIELFNSKKFEDAQKLFDSLDDNDKQSIFSQLFQSSQCRKMPSSVSVLFRRLHKGKDFTDFYEAWLPPKEKCNPETVNGYTYQNFFGGPIRVINAVNFEDPREIVSIGLHWVTDEELQAALRDPQVKNDGDERGSKISQVADKEMAAIYKVAKDDNLGTPF